jgi:DNA-binding NtrC family response regulator
MPRILIVEDDPAFARRMARNLGLDGFEADVAEGGEEGLRLAAVGAYDAALCDVKMPGIDGFEFLRRVRSGADSGIDPKLPVVILTSINSVESAVEAMRLGASDYLTKESGRAEIVLRVKRAMEQRDLADENERLRARLAQTDEFHELVGASPALDKIKQVIREVGPTPATVLITGETGAGKELVARAIHQASGRKGEFVEVNSALLPDDSMLQSELFGHERGSFTDAKTMKKGKLELADGGTLFLDEIGELSRETQAKLLRVLETLTFTRLGGTKPIKVDVRLVAATNRDLLAEHKEGAFPRGPVLSPERLSDSGSAAAAAP